MQRLPFDMDDLFQVKNGIRVPCTSRNFIRYFSLLNSQIFFFFFRSSQTLLFHIVVFENEIILENAKVVIPEWLEL